MNISKISDKNGYIKIAAFDHRDSLKKYVSEVHFQSFKELLTKEFGPLSTAVLVDPFYGQKAIIHASRNNIPLILTREESGYTDNPQGRVTVLNHYPADELKGMCASAIKLLLYFNPQAENATQQIKVLKQVKTECEEANLPLILEPITYPIDPKNYDKAEMILETLKQVKDYADVLKIEYPVDPKTDSLEKAVPYLKEFTKILGDKPWILLSRGAMEFETFKKAVQISKDNGSKGYAVGRAVWQELTANRNWDSTEEFIKTIGVKRMKELSEIF